MSKATRKTAALFVLVVTLFYAFQLIRFGAFAYEATWILAKKAISMETKNDLYRLGAICNSRKRINCSLKVFAEILKESPDNVHAIGNMAMNLALAGQYSEALPYFRLYFSSGGNGPDVAFSFAESYEKLGDKENAVTWYYNVLYQDAHSESSVQRLVHLLLELGNDVEALSVCRQLGAVNSAARTAENEVEEMIIATNRREPVSVSVAQSQPQAFVLRLPSLDGKNFLLPYITELGVRFFSVRDGANRNQMNIKDLHELNLSTQKIADKRMVLSGLRVGQYLLEKLEVDICETCETYLDTKSFFQMGASLDVNGKVPFLVIAK